MKPPNISNSFLSNVTARTQRNDMRIAIKRKQSDIRGTLPNAMYRIAPNNVFLWEKCPVTRRQQMNKLLIA